MRAMFPDSGDLVIHELEVCGVPCAMLMCEGMVSTATFSKIFALPLTTVKLENPSPQAVFEWVRRQSLMVHTYETPQRPDALVLLDCGAPKCAPAVRAALVDVLAEACAGTLKSLLEAGRATHLPLSPSGQGEFSGHDAQALPAMLRAVAAAGYSETTDFSRVLWLASRRMQRTGSTAILTTRLTPAVADAAIALSRMGSKMRFTLVTAGEPSEEEAQLLHLLFASGLETAHIRAA